MSHEELSRTATHRWRRYETPTLDQDDIRQIGRIEAWKLNGVRRDSVVARISNATRNAIRDDQRARNPSLGNGERIKSTAFVSTAVHDEAVCGKGTATVEACLESAPRGDVDLAIDILAAVDKLPERLRSVILRRYVDGTDQDQLDLAKTDGVSRAYIGQLEQKAMARLRKLLA